MDCAFCKGKRIKMDAIGSGIRTMQINLYSLLGNMEDIDGGIHLVGKNKLAYDNSSGEYAEQMVYIKYCPFCGTELERGE